MKTTVALVLSLLATVSCQQPQLPQLCMNVTTAGGLGCRCTTSFNHELAEHRYEVDCSFHNLSTLPGDWQISQQAHGLDLSGNLLTNLSSKQFSHWGNLEVLNLARNKFASLEEDVFSGLSNLIVLDISNNKLTTLPPKVFNGLTRLSELNLEMNNLQELDPLIFSPTPHLKTLNLGYNTELGKYLMDSPQFLTVVLLKNLTILSLRNMSITSIPKDLFTDVENLQELSLADNPLTTIDVLTPSLESLNLSGIDVTVINSGDFVYFPNLKKLQLDRLIHLKDVQQNAFEGLVKLEVLTMENCVQLHGFHEFAFGGPDSIPIPLQRFSLRRSGLHTLNQGSISSLKQLVHLDLQGNPWRCDCHLAWLRQMNHSIEDTVYLRCFSPEEHHNQALLSVDPKDFDCKTSPRDSSINSSLVMDIFIILVAVVVAGAILMVMWRRGFIPFRRRQTVGSYSHVTLEPNKAELEWDDKISTTSGAPQLP